MSRKSQEPPAILRDNAVQALNDTIKNLLKVAQQTSDMLDDADKARTLILQGGDVGLTPSLQTADMSADVARVTGYIGKYTLLQNLLYDFEEGQQPFRRR